MKRKNFYNFYSTYQYKNILNWIFKKIIYLIFIVWYKFKNYLASLITAINIPAFLLSLFITFPLYGVLILFNPIYFNIIYTIIIGFIFNFLLYEKLKIIQRDIIENILYYLFIISLFVFIAFCFTEIAYAETPELDPNLWNLQQELVAKRTEFYHKKELFDTKVHNYSTFYNHFIFWERRQRFWRFE